MRNGSDFMFITKKRHNREVNKLLRINLFTSQAQKKLLKEHQRCVNELAKANDEIARLHREREKEQLKRRIAIKAETESEPFPRENWEDTK